MKIKIFLSTLLLLSTMFCRAQQDTIMFTPIPLGTYLSEVAKNNLEYLSEQYNIKIAQAEVVMAKVFPDPELTFEAADDAFNLELGITLELGKRRSRVAFARTEAELEALAVEWFFQELRAEAAEAYLETILQRELLELKKQSYDYMNQLYRYDSLRSILGEISELDAKQSYLEAATLLNEVYAQQGEYLAAVMDLNQFMGNTSDQLFVPLGNWENIGGIYSLPRLLDVAIHSRTDLVAANKSVDLAIRNIKVVRAERRPDIGLMVGYEKDWKGFWPRRDLLKAGITVPLQFSNFNKGARNQAKYIMQQSQTDLRNTELQVRTEVSQAFYRFEALGRQAGQYRSGLLEEARSLLDGMNYCYRRGETDLLDLLMAQRTYNEVMEDYYGTMKEYASAFVELQKVSGVWDMNL